MFEIAECITIAGQMAEYIAGKTVATGTLGNSPHKFVWYNRKPKEFASLVKGRRVGKAYSRGRWMFIPLEPGYVLTFGECGGRIVFHESESGIPKKYHLSLTFTDGTALSAVTQMWGAMELYEKGRELERMYVKDMRVTPVDAGFDFEYFSVLIDGCMKEEKRSVKGLLTQDQLIPGLGNAIAQDIMYAAKMNPKRPIGELDKAGRKKLHSAIVKTVKSAIALGGRNDEYDLFGKPGGYVRLMDRDAEGAPCPECGTRIEKMQYLGGACYYCPKCQG